MYGNWNIEKFRQELKEIVNIDSGSYDKDGVAKICCWFEERFLTEGFKIVRTRENRTQLLVQTHDTDYFDVLMVGHMDTVFPKGTALKRPYKEEDNMAYGPGVADMKAGLLMIFHLMARLHKEVPEIKICTAFSGDEEVGTDPTAEWLKSLAEKSKFALVFEPGREGNCFVRSRKGCADLRIELFGKASHAGNAPEKGINAVVAMAEWIRELYFFHFPEMGVTVNPGVAKGGTAKNVIPDYAEIIFDIRYTNDKDLDRICKKANTLSLNPLVKGINTKVSLEGVFPPMVPSEKTKEYMKQLEMIAYKHGYKIGWADAGGVSDANHIASTGTPVICGCGPIGGELHSKHEWLDLTSVVPRMNLIYSLISSLQ